MLLLNLCSSLHSSTKNYPTTSLSTILNLLVYYKFWFFIDYLSLQIIILVAYSYYIVLR